MFYICICKTMILYVPRYVARVNTILFYSIMHWWRRLVGKSRTSSVNIRASYFLKCRHLADRSCISVAPPLRTMHELILSKFVCRIFLGAERSGGIPPVKGRPLVDRSCISVALLRTIHELILSKFVCRIFLMTSKLR